MSNELDQWEEKIAELFKDVANFSPEEQKKARQVMRSLGKENQSTESPVEQVVHDYVTELFLDEEPD